MIRELERSRKQFHEMQKGYYGSEHVSIGPEGGFETFPVEFSPQYGTLFAKYIMKQFNSRLDEFKGKKFRILELGPGTGHLAKDILDHIKEENPYLYHKIEYHGFDFSKPLIKKQKETLREHGEKYIPIHSEEGDFSAIKNSFDLVLAHEFLDDLFSIRIIPEKGKYVIESHNPDKPNQVLSPEFQKILENREVLPTSRPAVFNVGIHEALKQLFPKINRGGNMIIVDYFNVIDEGPAMHFNYFPQGNKVNITARIDEEQLLKTANELGFKINKIGQFAATNLPYWLRKQAVRSKEDLLKYSSLLEKIKERRFEVVHLQKPK